MNRYVNKIEKISKNLEAGKKVSEQDAIELLQKSFTSARSDKIYNGLKNSLGNRKFIDVMMNGIKYLNTKISNRQAVYDNNEKAIIKKFIDDQIQNFSDEDIKTLLNMIGLSKDIMTHLVIKLFEIGKYAQYKKEIDFKYIIKDYFDLVYSAVIDISEMPDFPQSRLPEVANEILDAYEKYFKSKPKNHYTPSEMTFYLDVLYKRYGKYFDKTKLGTIILRNLKILSSLIWMVDSTVMKNIFSNSSDEEKIEILNFFHDGILSNNKKISKSQILPILMLTLRDRNQTVAKLAKQIISLFKT